MHRNRAKWDISAITPGETGKDRANTLPSSPLSAASPEARAAKTHRRSWLTTPGANVTANPISTSAGGGSLPTAARIVAKATAEAANRASHVFGFSSLNPQNRVLRAAYPCLPDLPEPEVRGQSLCKCPTGR